MSTLKITLFAMISLLVAGTAAAQEVSILPQQITLEDGSRSATITLKNESEQAIVYRVSIGSTQDLRVSLFADNRQLSEGQVKLAAGESKRVRVIVRRGAAAKLIEHKTEIKFESLPNPAVPQLPTNVVIPVVVQPPNPKNEDMANGLDEDASILSFDTYGHLQQPHDIAE
jgi:P pilus assembly chaperone PapD